MDDISKFSTLSQFFGCYFHQDFIEEFGSPEVAFNVFLSDSSKDFIKLTSEELGYLISLKLSETKLSELLDKLSCDYLPTSDNLTINEWLIVLSKAMVLNCT
ncbi:MAG: contact-dependent growth inhibition system immunity protein [Colwellia sp.]|nr:contact-dependent growth inhibition system immunity protein [Colwellia sp.]